jgi:hypothetical protein
MRRLGLSVIAASVGVGVGAGELRAQPLGYYDPPYSYRGYAPPPAYYPLPPAYAPPRYFGPPAVAYYPRPAYEYGAPLAYPPEVELPPPRSRSCGRYRYWNGEYCADARYERPYVGPKW